MQPAVHNNLVNVLQRVEGMCDRTLKADRGWCTAVDMTVRRFVVFLCFVSATLGVFMNVLFKGALHSWLPRDIKGFLKESKI